MIAEHLKSYSFSRLIEHPWKEGTGDILLFCPGHYTRLIQVAKFSLEVIYHRWQIKIIYLLIGNY
jgi:hypothetical protein